MDEIKRPASNEHLFISASVDRESMLGRIACISRLINELRNEARELESTISHEEKRTDEIKRSASNEHLFIRVSVDRESMLGRIACISRLIDELSKEASELKSTISYEEKRTAESE